MNQYCPDNVEIDHIPPLRAVETLSQLMFGEMIIKSDVVKYGDVISSKVS